MHARVLRDRLWVFRAFFPRKKKKLLTFSDAENIFQNYWSNALYICILTCKWRNKSEHVMLLSYYFSLAFSYINASQPKKNTVIADLRGKLFGYRR